MVGIARKSDGTTYHAFRTLAFAPITDAADLTSLAGNYSSAYAINNAGEVVGTSKINSSVYHAFIVQSSLPVTMRDLNGLIATGSGWELRNAEAINDKGQIAGWGYLNGLVRAFLLDPTK